MYYAGQSGIAGAVGNLAGVSFPINESSRTRQIRGIRNLQEGAAGMQIIELFIQVKDLQVPK